MVDDSDADEAYKREELLRINGVGEAKLECYGRVFLEVVDAA